jgi:hypothetical protein
MSVRRPVLTPDHPAPGAAAHRQAGYPFSLAGTTPSDHHPPVAGVVIWLAAYGGAALLIATPARSGRAAAASLGLATGLLFDGGVPARLVGYGGLRLAALIVTYAAGTSALQSAYQRSDVLTASGTATLMTNAAPITAGLVLFGARPPHGRRAVLQLAAFACLVARAVVPGRQQTPGSEPN